MSTAKPGLRDWEAAILHALIHGPRRPGHIRRETGLTRHQFRTAYGSLTASNRVITTGTSSDRRMRLAEHKPHTEAMKVRQAAVRKRQSLERDAIDRIKLRERIRLMVSAEPGIAAYRVARRLDATLEDITEQVQWLLDHREITKGARGRLYRMPDRLRGRGAA